MRKQSVFLGLVSFWGCQYDIQHKQNIITSASLIDLLYRHNQHSFLENGNPANKENLRSATRIPKYPQTAKNDSDSQKNPRKLFKLRNKFRLIGKVFSVSLFMHKN